MQKILWATTFRGFEGTKNDMLQLRFLRSLADTNGVEIQLLVTQWGELGVEKQVRSFFQNALVTNHAPGKWSLSQLIQDTSGVLPDHDLVWSTCDIEFSQELPLLFSQFLMTERCLVSSFPNYGKLPDGSTYPLSGIDIIGVPASYRPLLEEYVAQNWNEGWGLFEHQLIAFYEQHRKRSKKPINIEASTKVYKNLNSRAELGETSNRLKEEWRQNLRRWEWLRQKWHRKRFLSQSYIKLLFRGSRLTVLANLQKYLLREIFSLIFRRKTKIR